MIWLQVQALLLIGNLVLKFLLNLLIKLLLRVLSGILQDQLHKYVLYLQFLVLTLAQWHMEQVDLLNLVLDLLIQLVLLMMP